MHLEPFAPIPSEDELRDLWRDPPQEGLWRPAGNGPDADTSRDPMED